MKPSSVPGKRLALVEKPFLDIVENGVFSPEVTENLKLDVNVVNEAVNIVEVIVMDVTVVLEAIGQQTHCLFSTRD